MIENLPDYVPFVFILTTLLTLWFLYLSVTRSAIDNPKSKANFIILFNVTWLIIQAILTYNGFYLNTKSIPPNIIFAVLPPFLIIIGLFMLQEGRIFMDAMSLKYLTYLHIIRIPVEFVLYWLFLNKEIPGLMTFTGRNFDILAGITAPFVAYFGFSKGKLNRRFLLAWNYICLALLLNIMVNAFLSAPFRFQQFAFDQPNIAVLYFPFNWLPAFIVPTVMFSHLVSIRQLSKLNKPV